MLTLRSAKRIVRASLSSLYLVLIVLTIPLAFDVGGVDCGLAFSLTAFLLYFFLTSVVLITRRTHYFSWVAMVYYAQHLFIPSLLTFFLSYYADPTHAAHSAWPIELWRIGLINSTSIFTILDGFCSLLLIQSIGQTVNWLMVYKSDSWLIVSLVASGSIITSSVYFLYRIYVFPFLIGIVSASLLGSLLTLTLIIGVFGIVSGKGSMIESSLLLAYIVHCIYEIFPILSSNATETLTALLTLVLQNIRQEIPILPAHFMNPVAHFLPFLTFNLPGSFRTVWEFSILCLTKLTVPIILNLVYRLGVLYAATKIIPQLSHDSADNPLFTSSNPDSPRSRPSSRALSRTPSITHLQNGLSIEYDAVVSSDDPNHHDLDDALVSPLDQLREPSSLEIEKSVTDAFAHPKKPSISRSPTSNHSIQSRKPPSATIRIIYAYAPCIVIAVYTHLMLLYNGELGTGLFLWGGWARNYTPVIFDHLLIHPWQFWNWVNMATTLVLYTAELLGLGSRQR